MEPWVNPLRRLSPITEHPSASPSASPPSRSATSSLSPAPSDRSMLLREAELKIEEVCTAPTARKLLLDFLVHLQGDGQDIFAADVVACLGKQQLLQLANHLLDAVLKPFALSGGKAPRVTTPPTEGSDETVDLAMSEITSSTRSPQVALRRDCLRRDGYRCVYTGLLDLSSVSSGLVDQRGRVTVTECAHILPFALGEFNEQNAHDTRNAALIWFALHRYFPELVGKIGPDTINKPGNAMTLALDVHGIFGSGDLAFEPLKEPDHYRIISIAGFDFGSLPKSNTGVIEFSTCDPTVPRPDPAFLTTHLVISRILHVSGFGQAIYNEAEEAYLCLDYHKLHPSGSTDVESILSRLFLTTVSASAGETGAGHGDDETVVEND